MAAHVGVRVRNPRVHPWRVLHAANPSAALLATITLQARAGMRPEVLSLAGLVEPAAEWATANEEVSASLLSAWHHVRAWRDALMASMPARFEVVHAHSFSAGMAAVRTCPAVVYEIGGFVEQLALQASAQEGEQPPGAWLSRSLRVAEQFVIARAGAIIVHSAEQRSAALDRGAGVDDVFLIPQSGPELAADELARRYNEAYHHASIRRESGGRGISTGSLVPLMA